MKEWCGGVARSRRLVAEEPGCLGYVSVPRDGRHS